MNRIVEDKETGVFVSDTGEVFKKVTQWSDKNGYKYVTVKGKNLAVHRLVAKAWVCGRDKDKRFVCHKDDNPGNNNANNLEWGTPAKNNYDAYARGLKTKNQPVRCMETGEVFHSAREAARAMFGIPKRGDHILEAIRCQKGKAYGYHWEAVINE